MAHHEREGVTEMTDALTTELPAETAPRPEPALRVVPSPPPELEIIDVQVPSTFYAQCGKRLFDIVAATTALVILLPILAAVTLLVRVSLGKDVLFRQVRVGHHGQDFEMLKFRTMREDRRRGHPSSTDFDGIDRRISHKRDDDPRHTRVGRVLRRYSIDELPQLINVLRGEMSMVGPRPELALVVDRIDARDHSRHLVRPGITGEWQVTQRQEGHPLADDFDDDLQYVGHVSLGKDLEVIRRTFRVVVAGSGR